MKKRVKVILIIVVVILVAISAYLRKDMKPKQAGRGSSSTVFTVETTRSTKGEITDYIKINGNVEPVRNIDIYPDAAGKLNRLTVALGDSVRTGQIIAEIDPSRPGLSFALNPVRSTIAGTITSLPYEVGATISLSSAVATVGDLSHLQIITEVAEPYVGKIDIGTRGDVSFVAWPERVFNTHIVEISPVVNPLTRTISIKLEFSRRYPELKAGMFASIRLLTETRRDIIIVPSGAVVTRGGGRYVFVVEDDKAVMTQVFTGLTVDGVTEIISGIPVDTEIVVRGQNLLDDGVDINILNRETTDGGSD